MLLVIAPAPAASTADDLWRLFIAVAGLLVCGACLRVAATAARQRDWENLSAIVAFALIVVAPATGSLLRFGVPLNRTFAVIYTLGLVAALVALGFRLVVRLPWLRFWRPHGSSRVEK